MDMCTSAIVQVLPEKYKGSCTFSSDLQQFPFCTQVWCDIENKSEFNHCWWQSKSKVDLSYGVNVEPLWHDGQASSQYSPIDEG